MNENLLSAIQKLITPDFINRASGLLGETEEKTKGGFFSATLPLLAGLFSKGSTLEGVRRLMNMTREEGLDAEAPPNYLDFLRGGNTTEAFLQKGKNILEGIFGGRANSVVEKLANKEGMNYSTSSSILRMLAPMALGVLGSIVKKNGLSPSSLMAFLGQQKTQLADQIPEFISPEPIFKDVKREEPPHRRTDYESPPNYQERETRKSWLPAGIGLAALLALGGYFLTRDRGAQDRALEQAGTVVQKPSEEQRPSESVQVQSPEIEDEVSAFLETGSDSELPKRFVFKKLLFMSGTAQLTPESQETVENLANVLKDHPNTEVRLEGYTDNTGTTERNQKLSSDRAEAVKTEMVNKGVNDQQITTVGRGQENPVASNASEEGRSENRRIELIILRR